MEKATAKLMRMGVFRGPTIRLEQATLYYKSVLESSMSSFMTNVQLDDPAAPPYSESALHGYQAARIAGAKPIRKLLNIGWRTPPEGVLLEAGIDFPDQALAYAKLGFHTRLKRRTWEESTRREELALISPEHPAPRREALATVFMARTEDVEQT